MFILDPYILTWLISNSLEENCKDHQQYLNVRANPPQEQDMNYELSGHAMMLTNPPPSHIEKCPNVEYHQAPNIPANNLLELMETAQRLPLNGGEIPPILALRIIREDERYQMLTRRQFKALTEKLRESSRCYGYVLPLGSSDQASGGEKID